VSAGPAGRLPSQWGRSHVAIRPSVAATSVIGRDQELASIEGFLTAVAMADVVTDVEEQARHLALAANGPSAVAAAHLAAAADQAAGRGATAAAAELLELAADLTPDDPALERERRFRAASLHRLAGGGEQAAAILGRLLDEAPPGVERADVLFELALTRRAQTPEIIRLCDEALAEAESDDLRSARILAFRSVSYPYEADARPAVEDANAARRPSVPATPTLIAMAIAGVGHAVPWSGEITPGLLERGLEIEERLGLVLEYHASPRFALARLLMRQGEIDRPRALFEEVEASAVARGDEGTRIMVLWAMSMLEWLTGRWPRKGRLQPGRLPPLR
jgi:tetratricopeptide (TPR) repeat protein